MVTVLSTAVPWFFFANCSWEINSLWSRYYDYDCAVVLFASQSWKRETFQLPLHVPLPVTMTKHDQQLL